MAGLFIYSLILSVALCVFMGLYYLLSSRLTLFRFNRALLLSGLVVSLLIPVAAFVSPSSAGAGVTMEIPTTVMEGPMPYGEVSTVISAGGWWRYGVMIYGCGVAVAAIYFLLAVSRLLLFIYGGERFKAEGRSIVVHDRAYLVPFSWGGYIVVSRNDFDAYERMVILHESAHLDAHHWLDLLLAQIVITLAWYCPAAWYMRSALQSVHEYEADMQVLAHGINSQDYQLFLIKKTVGARLESIADSLRNSSLKNRITMMQSKKSNGLARIRAIAMVPVMALLLTGVSSTDVRGAVEVLSSESQSPAMPLSSSSDDDTTKVYSVTMIMAQFPGGDSALMKYIAENIHYPVGYNESGCVVVQFIVKVDGSIDNIRIVNSKLPDVFNEEAIRVVKSLPAFEPGKMNDGKPVDSWYTIPISFNPTSSESESTSKMYYGTFTPDSVSARSVTSMSK